MWPGGRDERLYRRRARRASSGPEASRLCPILGGKGCAKFEQAHGIVFELDLDRPQHRAIVHRYRELGRPDLPIRVVVRPDQQARYADLLDEVQVRDHSPTVADLDGFAAQVEAAATPDPPRDHQPASSSSPGCMSAAA